MESSNSTRSNQPSPTSCEPEPELECETKDDEAVVDDDSTTSSDIDTDNPVTTPVQEPEGTVIHELFHRKVIRHGDKVTKINRQGIKPSEAEAMRFVRERTTIPVPRLLATTRTSITMEFVEGTTLQKAWNGLSDAERATVSAQLRDYLDQLRAIKGSYIGGLNGGPAIDSRILCVEGGPFDSEAKWNDFLLEDLLVACPAAVRSMVYSQLRTDHDIVLTHGDLSAMNILVRDGCIVALIDWERAGFYPEYFELVKTLRCADWRVGYYSALLDIFPRRYDAEYLVDSFISRISKR